MPLIRTKILFIFFLVLCSIVLKAQVASFTVDHTSGCSPLIVHFHNTSTGATNYTWDFGNTGTSFFADASTTYDAGTYTVTLTAINGASSTTSTAVITVYPQPVVAFTASDVTLCPGIGAVFTSTSTGGMPGGITYNWNFGDGSTSALSAPSQSYPSPGDYNITLFVTNSGGCTNSLTKNTYIHVFPIVSANFSSASTYACKAPASFSFTNSSTGTTPIGYSWTFGDGGTSPVAAPVHSYPLPGSYDVKLVATDANGCISTLNSPGYINIGNLHATFTSTTSVCRGIPVSFSNTSSSHILSDWNFGDGGVASAESPIYSFTTAGTYSVKLVVYNGICYDTVIHPITVNANPVGSFTITPTVPCPAPVTINYTATTPPGSIVTWLFFDTATGSGNAVSHTYTTATIDTVVMTMVNGFGCKASVGQIDTNYQMNASIRATRSDGCIPLIDTFICLSSVESYSPLSMQNVILPFPYTITGYTWNFGDGSPPLTGAAPAHTFTTAGTFTVTCTIAMASGCSKTTTTLIKTGIPPVVSYSATPTHICAGQKVHFTGAVTGLQNSLTWTYGEGSDSPATLLETHQYFYPAVDSAYMVAYYNGCRSLPVPKLAIFVDSPGALFGFNFLCTPEDGIAFTNFSPGSNSQVWLFGDGDTSAFLNPVHYFPSLSLFNVKLTTYNATNGCRDTLVKQVDLTPPFLYFYALDTSICKDEDATIISFVIPGLSGGNATMYYWFVDTTLVDSAVDILTYAAHTPGLHNITMLIADNRGCMDTFSRNNYLLVGNPVDTFASLTTAGCGPLAVNFTDYSTGQAAAGAPIVSYAWNFGDGATSTISGLGTVHSYTAAGAYYVTETIKDNIGCTATWTLPDPIIVHRPTVSFAVANPNVCRNTSVHFYNLSTDFQTSLWSFGDGATSTVTAPDHVYTAAGTYTVRLIVTDTFGCPDTLKLVNYITVQPSTFASFTMSDSFAVCPPLNVSFTNTSTGASSYYWSFGTGATSIATSPANPYTAPGYYPVLLVATNSLGCKDTAIHHANVFGYNGAFSYTPIGGCTPLQVHFTATLGSVASLVWDFSDGVTSSALLTDTISHTYESPGIYLPKLILTDTSGCTNFSYGADTIKVDTLTADFSMMPNPVCQNSPVVFGDLSHATYSVPASWLWTFASGATSTVAAPSYSYSASGTFPVVLTVTSNNGCTRSVTKSVSVNPIPAAITGVLTVCPGYTTTLSTSATTGTWSSGSTAVATVSSSGLVSGLSLGTAAITYTLPTGCLTSVVVTVFALPAAITGVPEICVGDTTQMYNATPGGSWSSGNTAVATISSASGLVTGVSGGTTTITYELGTGCITTKVVTVHIVPDAITGTLSVCESSTTNLGESIGGGIWSSSEPSVATVDAVGIVTALSGGSTTISYVFGTGCSTDIDVTVNPLPAPITGVFELCAGFAATLSDTTSGGTWTSSIPGIASITASGVVDALMDGISTIAYTISTGCQRAVEFTVDPLPAQITGTFDVCVASTIILSDASAGGTWSVADPAVAVIDFVTGAITGAGAGTTIVTYTLPTGCIVTHTLTVETLPPPIDGSYHVCAGFAVNLTDGMPGGIWTSDPLAAGIGTIHHLTGVVTGITGGTVTVTYTVFTGCAVSATVTVDVLPPPVSGPAYVCQGSTLLLSDPAGPGSWESSVVAVASVDATTGLVTGVLPGVTVITYTISSGCFNILHVTVNPLPAPITGADSVCEGAVTTLHNATPSGDWLSGNTAIATVGYTSGIVTGISAGFVNISYGLPTGCVVTKTVEVHATPPPITGNGNICSGAPVLYTDVMSGGTWSSSNTSVVTIGASSGVAIPIILGTSNISYIVPAGGCFATKAVTVQPLPIVYNMTGCGSYCAGGNGVHIGLDGSQIGVSYVLYYGSSVTGYKAGTGLPLDFGLLTPAGLYTVLATNATSGCSKAMSGSELVTIDPLVVPVVVINGGAIDTSCPGVSVTLTPAPLYGGAAPVYLWSVNGINVSTADSYTYVPANGDVVSVMMNSNGSCLLTDVATGIINMTVLPSELPIASVLVDPGDTICQFTPTTFTAEPTYGGNAPVYLWNINGTYMGSGPVYSYVPVQGDIVYVAMVSNYLCRTADTVVSTNVNMVIDTLYTPHVTIVPNPGLGLEEGKLDTLTTIVANAGPDPKYQWRLNGHPIAGATMSSYVGTFRDYDSIVCAVTSSGMCDNITSFDWVFVSVYPLLVQHAYGKVNDLQLVPNPNNGIFTIRGAWEAGGNEWVNIQVTDVLGQVVYSGQLQAVNGTINSKVDLGNSLANGMYVLCISGNGFTEVFHFVIRQ